MNSPDRFPQQFARTRRFSLGRPRAVRVFDDRVLFLRSSGGEDPVTDLWAMELATGRERRLVAAREVAGEDDDLPPAERARRERAREMAGGIVAYATDRDGTVAAFALAGRLFTVDVDRGELVEEQAAGPAFDPRPDPGGQRVAYASGDALHVVERGGGARVLAAEDGATWGRAEFIAAEEMGRSRGFWWSPDGTAIAATHVDEREVPVWHIADPAHPEREPVAHRYPAAGTTNAAVRLAVFGVEENRRVDVRWDREAYPYLAEVVWSAGGPLTLLVQSRDQRAWQVLAVDDRTGAAEVVREDRDGAWLEIVPGAPAWVGAGRLAMVLDLAEHGQGARAIVVGDEVVTPPELQVRSIVDADERRIVFTASPDPTTTDVHRLDLATGDVVRLTEGGAVHAATASGDVVAISTAAPLGATEDPAVVIRRGGDEVATLVSHAATPVVRPEVEFLELGPDRLRAALLRPAGPGPWPVLLDPYGGPHAQRVIAARDAFLTSQWFADNGFAVLVVDGRGTPGRGPAFERAVRGDLATGVLEDQVTGLLAAADHEPGLDLQRVGIRGWSFGGYLAALAVLRRPDVFHAAVAGAPVTDWRLYDTHYTERYLGHPDTEPAAYAVSSLVDEDGLTAVAEVEGPPPALMIIHGLADDNVVAAHSLRLSHALLAAGRPHRFLPLSGVTHMTPQEVVAANLLLLQRDFLRRSLGGS